MSWLSDLLSHLAGIKAKTDNLPADPSSESLIVAAISSRTVPGDPMTLTGAEETAVQAKILSDATPFPGADIPLIKAKTDNCLSSVEAWSTITPQVVITAAGGNLALGTLAMPATPAGRTIILALIYVKFRTMENTNAAPNSLSGAQTIQFKHGGAGGSYITGITLNGGELACIATSGQIGGDVLMGTDDVSAQIPSTGVAVLCQITGGKAAQNNLNLNDVQWGVKAWFS